MQKLIFTVFLTTMCYLSLFSNSITVEILELEDTECFGEASGFIELEASNGVAPYNFTLNSEVNNTGSFEDLEAGSYSVVVTDQSGCSETVTFEIDQPNEIILITFDVNETGCEGISNGSFQLETDGGTGTYTYTLGNEVNTTGLFENLAAGTYEPLVEDQNGCESTIMVVIENGPGLFVNIVSQMNVDCFGNSTGQIELEAANGQAPYEYRIGSNVNTTGIFENLASGTYSVLIADNAGCLLMQNVTITEPTILTASVTQITNVSCFGAGDGSFQITANGGTQGYTYVTANDSNTDGIFTNQNADTYNISITDANGCTVMVMATIAEPSEIVVNMPTATNVDCNGNATGSIQLSATGGAGGFSYSTNGQTNDTGSFSNLAAGIYMVIIADASGCSSTTNVEVAQPDELIGIVDAIFNINCAGGGTGGIDFGTTGGTGDFTFTLNGMSNNTGFFENLSAGNYTATIVDANGCETTAMGTIEESDGLGVNIIALADVTCNGDTDGSVTLEANGGSGNYTYTLDGEMNTTGTFNNLVPGDYTAFLTDDLECSTMVDFIINEPATITVSIEIINTIDCAGDNNASILAIATGGTGDLSYSIDLQNNDTGIFENLSAGVYPVMVSDANGCSAIEEIVIDEPAELQILVPNFGATTCFDSSDGFIQVMGMGGTGDYIYMLDNGTSLTGLYENLAVGNYDISVMDANGCDAMIQFTVGAPNEVFGAIINLQNAGCNLMLGSIEVQGMGGTGAFTYTLGTETNDTGVFENIEAGTYEMLLTDANGCEGNLTFNIEEGEDITAMLVEQDDVECFGEETGFAQISATGGVNITYTLDNETNDTGIFENLPAGNYEVVVSSGGGCSATIPVTIEQPEQLVFDIAATSLLCAGVEDGSLQIIATGGTGDYSYTLNEETNETGLFENLTDGSYIVEVEDENGCVVTSEFTIEAPVVLILTILDIEDDNGSNNGSFNVQGSGGTSPYQFSLDGVNFQNSPPFSDLMFGEYTAYIMDANGCVALAEVTVPFFNNTYSLESGVADMTIFPNPFVNNLTIELDLYRGQNLNFTLFSTNGQVIQKMSDTFAAGKTNVNLTILENLASGTYFLQVVGAEFQGHFKVVKQ
ncbi:MAG: hypothetical protein ACI9LN_003278 [Saprospiraceae bacterium]|jgi:hypothetical protein